MLAALDDTVFVKFLGNEDLGVQYLSEAVTFFFAVNVFNSLGRKGLIANLSTGFLRTFGDINIALAIGLGAMPGAVFKNLDHHMWILVAAYVWVWFSNSYLPSQLRSYLAHASDLSHSIVKANNAGAGYAAAAAALGGSFWAPLFGAYVAVNGARLIENGVSAISKKRDNDDTLAIISGLVIYLLTAHLGASALGARAFLVLFSFTSGYVDYEGKFNAIFKSATGAASPAMKRGRSQTPKRK